METAEINIKANEQLLLVIPLLDEMKEYIESIKQTFVPIKYYGRFKYQYDTPRILPIKELYSFCKKMEFFRDSFLEFKKTFNENDLPPKLHKIFMKIFIKITREQLRQNQNTHDYMIGGCCGVWPKSSSYVLKHWHHYDYSEKTEYSQHAYNHIVGYFALFYDIVELKKQLAVF